MRRSAYILFLGILFFGFAQLLQTIGFWKIAGLAEPRGYLMQGFLFLGLLFVLQNTLFEPYLRVLQEREAETSGKRARAEKTRLEAEEMIGRYRNSISEARVKAAKERERHGLAAEEEERGALKAAKDRANTELRERVEQIRNEADQARAELVSSVEPLASEIVRQVLRS